ncbi:hypothetical protein BH10ACT2_BH10ACT2_18830 [soil metagenome]
MEQRNWPRTRDELNKSAIQVRVATVDHIFNPMDPTPLEERSLNPEVADWIEEWAEDLDKDHPITVEIYFADGRFAGREQAIVDGLHHHFEYREWQEGREFRKLLRQGRFSLVIGIIAFAGFSTASRVIGSSDNPVVEVLHEGLSVLGWVSMWKPLEILLYDWWPIRRERRACRRLAEATVTFPTTAQP